MNYSRFFDGKVLLKKQPLVDQSALGAMYRGKCFDQPTVDSFNGYTIQFNRATSRPLQEEILDKRNRLMLNATRRKYPTTQRLIAA
ncbi:hypothetical protein [Alteromonas sp. H39]|uniref:hypothetical protein n=1 Tax=Alteromonas sp. H39 TaxID=3389876 RepID=UPI0039DF4999